MNITEKGEKRVEKCIEILCNEIYRMCKELYSGEDKTKISDPKSLKEACAAVKEAQSLLNGISKRNENENEIKIMFSDTEDYAE